MTDSKKANGHPHKVEPNTTISSAIGEQGAAGEIIHLRIFTVFMRKDGILECDVFPHAEMNLDDGIECIDAQALLAQGMLRPLLVKMGEIKSIDTAARSYIGGKEAAKNVHATALLIQSHVGRVIGNFMLGLNKTIYPTRLFTSEDEAVAWLKGFLR